MASARDSDDLRGRHLITMRGYRPEEIELLLDTAGELKQLRRRGVYERRLEHRNIAAVFLKPSLRTRAAFLVAASEEGAHLESFRTEDVRFGVKESVADIARVLGRLFDGIAFRGFEEAVPEALAEHAGVPVWNALTDGYHPTQVLADLLTLREAFGEERSAPLAYVGDGRNNVARSLASAAFKLGLDLRILAPAPLQPPDALLDELRADEHNRGGEVMVTDDPDVAMAGAAAIYSDVWVSMGEEEALAERVRLLRPYKVTAELVARTGRPDTVYLHCLPALHDLETTFARANPDVREVDDDVFAGPRSRVFDQAENRMHTIKALMVLTC